MSARVWRKGWFATGFALLYASFLLIEAPASLVAWALGAATSGALSLERPYGRLWNGSATALLITYPAGFMERYERPLWAMDRSRLVRGEPVWLLTLDDARLRVRARVSISGAGVFLSDVNILAPASTFAQRLAQSAGPSGTVSLQADQIEYRNNRLLGEATARWRSEGGEMLQDYHIRLDEFRVTTR